MQTNVVNSALLQQPTQTAAGTPILQANPIPPENVTPTFILPEEGQKPEDKHPKNKNPYSSDSLENEPEHDEIKELPEAFKLILASNFDEIFKSFFTTSNDQRIAQVQRLFRLSNGNRESRVFSKMYTQKPKLDEVCLGAMEKTLMYHYNRPGKRFKGAI